MVKVFILDVDGLPDPLHDPGSMNGFSEERKSKILGFKRLQERKQSLGAGIILSEILKLYGKSMNEIYYGENGKPQIDRVHFNLSHSGSKVVCAVSEKEVGIDIQKIGQVRETFAQRYFGKREQEYLEKVEVQKRMREIFRIWTMKESYLKMTGEGLSLELERIEFLLGDKVSVFRDHKPCDCYIKEYILPGYNISVCARENEFVKEMKEIAY